MEIFLSFLLTCIVIESTPGPNMAYLAIVGAGDGRRAGFAAVAGVALGLLIVGLAAALGLAAVVAEFPAAYETLRWGGALYLLWLAWDGWRSAEAETAHDHTAPNGRFLYFRRGLVTNLLNPKAALFYVTVLPGFIPQDAEVASYGFILTLVYVAVATTIHICIVAAAERARPFLTDPRRSLITRRALSALLAVIALWLLLSTGRG